MDQARIRVLLIEDNAGDARLIEYMLAQATGLSFALTWVTSLDAAAEVLNGTGTDAVLLDLGLPGSSGLDTLFRLRARTQSMPPLIVMSGLEDEEIALRAVQAGAQDYLVKGQVDGALLVRSLRYAIERGQTKEALRQAHADLELRVAERTADLARTVQALQDEIAEREQAVQTMQASEARIRRLVESNIIGVCFWGADDQITDANEAFLRIVGYSREDIRRGGVRFHLMSPPEYQSADERATDEIHNTGSCVPYEKEYIRKDGDRVPVLVGGTRLDGEHERGVAFVLDLTERKRAEERVRYLAQHDALTDLPNRLLFRDRVTQAIAQAQRSKNLIAVLFIDLDHFKNVNDSLGHQIGDELLQTAAQRLRACVRTGDSVARLGGDEFVISLPALHNGTDVLRVAGQVLDTLREPFLIGPNALRVSSSIGIALYPTDGQNADELMRAADTAMYYAKEKGRDNFQFFTARLNDAAQRRLAIANRLYPALNQGELSVHYQPQVNLESGEIFAAEALVRWQSPDLGTVPPHEFIKIAEETGFIAHLGEWVLREACKQLAAWWRAGHTELRVAVNLSPHQFMRPGFPDLAARILNESGLPATALEMEITEGVLMMQSVDNVATLEQLAGMGIRIAIDDFGTGYSSLAYLQRFPIQILKIDQSFVNGIGEDASDTSIVTAIIAMAHSLRLKVVAEGVETAEQANFLKRHGCFAAQGYHFSRPVPPGAFQALLDRQDSARNTPGVPGANALQAARQRAT